MRFALKLFAVADRSIGRGRRFSRNFIANRQHETETPLSPFSRQGLRSEVLENRSRALSGVIDPAQHSCLCLADATWREPSKQIGSQPARSRHALHLTRLTYLSRCRDIIPKRGRGSVLSIKFTGSRGTRGD